MLKGSSSSVIIPCVALSLSSKENGSFLSGSDLSWLPELRKVRCSPAPGEQVLPRGELLQPGLAPGLEGWALAGAHFRQYFVLLSNGFVRSNERNKTDKSLLRPPLDCSGIY